ncbi:phosphogluconate dehydrogenase (NAD(+)-dependent, decarboxylating) [Anaeromyxobacter diazotrophicus]|uniref:6-phosphogluconate dehydrogenase n=1 Tax=Anaeromyxobacter diazotrophicus TaxID=2590199 RepID=A0A7I9VRJ3_9BACT|nr:decarboxylating 6-phosphogluconate dehydrogenase [Anaeromyxobacter diazotrophicus]GEJ58557.1 6-phosphogluconate dehydrogenase [Anaeromyxobacter diazotrophicus]
MQIGMYGLGRMGANMARRLARRGHAPVVWNITPEPFAELAAEGAVVASSLADLVARLTAPRTVWLMLPAGAPTERAVEELSALLAPGDALVDGGNTFYKDDVRRAEQLRARGLHYLDVGTSGGVWGLERGYCLMIGGPAEPVARLGPVFRALAPGDLGLAPALAGAPPAATTAPHGFLHCGPAGAGHFVKMIHNGIEYGLMQAYAEGFDLLRHAGDAGRPEGQRYPLDLAAIAELWRRGSVVSSWLLDLAARALAEDPRLAAFSGRVADSGEGRWTLEAALEEAVPAGVLAAALFARFRSREEHGFADQLLSALRHQFGGHGEAPPAGGAKEGR